MRKTLLGAASLALVALVTSGTTGSAAPVSFGKPVRLTEPNFGGYEPSIKVDQYNNVVITAHKANHTILLGKSPSGSNPPVRGASFLWVTSNAGKTFKQLPGLTAANENALWPAAEGDFAMDGAKHLYFVDTYLGDNALSRWTMGGNGEITADFHRPFQGTGSVDDRPWIAAHGNGVVMYLGNAGTSLKSSSSPITGRYTVYMSYDGGLTFTPAGVNLPDSGWCHGAADPRKGSKQLYVLCNNDRDTLYAYTSRDDGRTFTRSTIGEYALSTGATDTYPSVSVGADGTVHALFNLSDESDDGEGSRLIHFTSRNGGKSWARRDITPRAGFHHYTWMDVAKDGTVGVAYYFRRNKEQPWTLYAGTARRGQRLSTVPIANVAPAQSGSPHGDFFQVAFGPDRKLNIAYTVTGGTTVGGVSSPDIYYVKQR